MKKNIANIVEAKFHQQEKLVLFVTKKGENIFYLRKLKRQRND